jgi:type I restriction-modification system DNA methylase subunit
MLLTHLLIKSKKRVADHGEVFTPPWLVETMLDLVKGETERIDSRFLEPACGSGNFLVAVLRRKLAAVELKYGKYEFERRHYALLVVAQNYHREHHPQARLYVYGQDYNKRAFATAASDMLIKQVDHNGGGDNIRFGDTFTDDQFPGETFDYFLTNPPFGVDWKKQQKEIEREHEKLGFAGRFGAGLPRVNDGALLFLQHMISKFEPVAPEKHKHGSRLNKLVQNTEHSQIFQAQN